MCLKIIRLSKDKDAAEITKEFLLTFGIYKTKMTARHEVQFHDTNEMRTRFNSIKEKQIHCINSDKVTQKRLNSRKIEKMIKKNIFIFNK